MNAKTVVFVTPRHCYAYQGKDTLRLREQAHDRDDDSVRIDAILLRGSVRQVG